MSLEAAAARGEALDHVLLAGPPGLGKTSLAQILAAELDVPFVMTAGPALERKGDIARSSPRSSRAASSSSTSCTASRARWRRPSIPRWRTASCRSPSARARARASSRCDLPPFTLVGATTRAGLLTTPLRDRFGIQHRLEPYDPVELAAIVRRSAGILGCELDDGGAEAIARRSRGTPRVANRLLKRVRDYAEVRAGRRHHRRGGRRRARPARGRPGRPGPPGPRDPLRDLREVRRRPGRAVDARGRRWGRRRTRSRTSTSPTCSSRGSSSARRAAAAPRGRVRPPRARAAGRPSLF